MELKYQILIALALDLVLGDPRCLPHPVAHRRPGHQAGSTCETEIPADGTAGIFTAAVVILTTAGLAACRHSLPGRRSSTPSCVMPSASFCSTRPSPRATWPGTAWPCSGPWLRAICPKATGSVVSRMVGRDTEQLDEEGITRAAVESVAENTVDGVIAPLFFAFLAGPVGALVVQGRQHAGLDLRIPERSVSPIRLGLGQDRRRGQLPPGPA